jgi:hypothetical protein
MCIIYIYIYIHIYIYIYIIASVATKDVAWPPWHLAAEENPELPAPGRAARGAARPKMGSPPLRQPRSEIMGVRLGMTESHEVLHAVATRQPDRP